MSSGPKTLLTAPDLQHFTRHHTLPTKENFRFNIKIELGKDKYAKHDVIMKVHSVL